MKHSQPKTVQAVIHLEVPEFQIGQEVSVYFKDTMCTRGVCEKPKTGHWIALDEKSAVCSCCNRNNTLYGDFCKWCGAKMESEDKE